MQTQQISEGVYIQDKKNCYYAYAQTWRGRTQTGIVACVAIDDYLNQVVKKHENTREEKEQDRIRHVDTCSAQSGPIFLAYRSNPILQTILEKIKREMPIYDFVSEDGIGHTVWCIDDEKDIAAIEEIFAEIPSLYIADGHHRAASAIKVGQMRRKKYPDYDGSEAYNYFLSVIFPDEELRILDYNRLLKGLNGLSQEDFLKRVAEDFVVEFVGDEAVKPQEKGVYGMYLGHQWYRLSAKPEIMSEDAVEGLDVSVLQNYLLGPVLGIDDPRTRNDIEIVGGIRGTEELERRCHEDMCLAFSLCPTAIGELFAVADAGRLMPPKSTWFEPKLRSGIFIHQIEE